MRKGRIEERRAEALERKEAHEKRTTPQKIARAEARPGESKKELERLRELEK